MLPEKIGGMPVKPATPDNDSRLRQVARGLEATFMSEMLKSAGVGASRTTFGGGHGEDQFSSFMRDAQAREMVRAGGIGLAEALFQSLKDRQND